MKKFDIHNYRYDASSKRHNEIYNCESIVFNRLRKQNIGKEFRNYEMMLYLAKHLDTYRSMDVLTIFVKYGIIMRKSRGVYCFTEKPIYKNNVFKAYTALRAKHLCKLIK